MRRIRVATYNIHKGVQGHGPMRRLEIHHLAEAVQQFDADIVCLQEVRKLHRREALHFLHWPTQAQADFLAPEGYQVVYRSNAITRHGEHGNAMLCRWPVLGHQHEDISDHRFEQRGFLHARVDVEGVCVHVLVLHLGLIRASRVRQLQQVAGFIGREISADAPLIVAGDFNDWGTLLSTALGSVGLRSATTGLVPTFPSRVPVLQLDHIYVRGLRVLTQQVPRGRKWWRMSDHLPLIVDLALDQTSASQQTSAHGRARHSNHHV
ncbi:MAG: endonuclease/exonuclease/phosphatase family protein [Rhodoferax sp.]|nr:endonuclease/exonuclease/phosphatase family protein [Rhodoferax sp.]